MCIFITGYGQNETLSCLINYNLQRSGCVKALTFGCCAALTHPDPVDMIQTSRQSLSAAQTLSPVSTHSLVIVCRTDPGNPTTESQKNFQSDAAFTE